MKRRQGARPFQKIPGRFLADDDIGIVRAFQFHHRRIDDRYGETGQKQRIDEAEFPIRQRAPVVISRDKGRQGRHRILLTEHHVSAGDCKVADGGRGNHVPEIDQPADFRRLKRRSRHQNIVIIDIVVDRRVGEGRKRRRQFA